MGLSLLQSKRLLSQPVGPRVATSAVAIPRETEQTLEILLRIGVAACFIGHGAFGIITKEAWIPYFALVGIPREVAFLLMPLVGTVDILMGVLALVAPSRAVLLYTAVWALWTALLRPVAGESVWEVLERAGNYGVPLAFLLAASRVGAGRALLGRLRVPALGVDRRLRVFRVLQWTTGLLLIGHGGFGVFERKALLGQHWSVVGLPSEIVPIAGAMEIAVGLLVLVRPRPALFLFVFGWKVATELLYPLAGAPVWEFIERGGSYIAPLAAFLLLYATPGRRLNVQMGTATRVAVRVLFFALPLVAMTGSPATAQSPPADLLGELRRGGYILACRHAITDHDQPDPASGQRILSDAGREQARRLGAAIRQLDLPLGPVLTSPSFRTLESAQLSFGAVEIDNALISNGNPAGLPALFSEPVRGGKNRVLMTHQGILRKMLPQYGSAPIEEGDCLVLRPNGTSQPTIIARVSADDWERLRN